MTNAATLTTEKAVSANAPDTPTPAVLFKIDCKKQKIELIVLPLALSVLVASSLAYCLNCLLNAALPQQQTHSLNWFAYVCALSIISFIVGARARGFIRFAVLVQLGALALIGLNGFTNPSAAIIVDVFAGIACGGAAGALSAIYAGQRKQLDAQSAEIILRRKQLREAKLALVKHDEVERRLLAGDLHDQVLHDLKLARQTVSTCRSQIDEEVLNSLQKDLSHAMTSVREVMDQLFPASLEHLGLVGAIEECLDNASNRCGFETFVRSKVSDEELWNMSKVESLLVFRLIQESVNNIIKHAHATSVGCHILRENGEIIIRMVDNGVGLGESNGEGRGTRYMKQRAELIGATIAWLPNNPTGTIVEIRLRSQRDSQKNLIS